MTYTAVDIAKYIVSYCSGKHRPVSNLKLQKMLYYTWIDYYKKTGTALSMKFVRGNLDRLYLMRIMSFALTQAPPSLGHMMLSFQAETQPSLTK